MNPFITIVGVITTFLAFLIQVRANEQQRKDFITSINKSYVDEKIDSYNKLELLHLDIKTILSSWDMMEKSMSEFCTEIEADPYKMSRLKRTQDNVYKRLSQIDRNLIYNGYKLFVKLDNDNWKASFDKLSSISEYLPDALTGIYTIADSHSKEVYEEKKKIFEGVNNLDNTCVEIINRSQNKILGEYVRGFLNAYRNEQSISGGEANFKRLLELIEYLHNGLFKMFEENAVSLAEINPIMPIASNLLIRFNCIVQISNQTVPEIRAVIEHLMSNEDSTRNELFALSEEIRKVVESTSVDEIKKYIQQ